MDSVDALKAPQKSQTSYEMRPEDMSDVVLAYRRGRSDGERAALSASVAELPEQLPPVQAGDRVECGRCGGAGTQMGTPKGGPPAAYSKVLCYECNGERYVTVQERA